MRDFVLLFTILVAAACSHSSGSAPADAANPVTMKDAKIFDDAPPPLCGGLGTTTPASCGQGCAVCPSTSNGSATCDGVSCSFACDAGYHLCTTGCCRDLKSIAVGGIESCAITQDEALECWGGWFGTYTPKVVAGFGSGVAQVALGEESACVLSDTGGVSCWGTNSNGQLGNGTTTDSTTPVAVSGLSGVTQIVAGPDFYCALATGGAVQCWGHNGSYQLGSPAVTAVTTPHTMVGSGATAIAASEEAVCALTAANTATCWGDFSITHTSNYTATYSLPGAVSLVGGAATICAVTGAGAVSCWGVNDHGEFGDGNVDTFATQTPTASSVDAVAQLIGGQNYFCAATRAGAAKCWGQPDLGELGWASTTNVPTPTTVPGLGHGVTMMAAGPSASTTCALAGNVYCWGWNNVGQVGDGGNMEHDSPFLVPGL